MTTDNRPPAPSAGRGRTTQDELLHDLRQASPMPIVPTAVDRLRRARRRARNPRSGRPPCCRCT